MVTKHKTQNTKHKTQNLASRAKTHVFSFLIFTSLVVSFSCEPKEEDILDNAHRDSDFISFFSKTIELNNNAILNFKTGVENTLSLKKAIEDSDYEAISKMFNFKNSDEFLTYARDMQASLKKFISKFPSLKSTNGINVVKFREIVEQHLELNPALHFNSSLSSRTTNVGCNVIVCTRKYSDCRMGASADLAVSTSQCLSFGAIVPTSYFFCQGTVNLVYAADMSGCNSDFDICCPV